MRNDRLERAYKNQRVCAFNRGIEWQFTYGEWLAVWVASGRLMERGNRGNQYVMCRRGDAGPYSADNVEILTASQNLSDSHRNGCHLQRMTKAEIQAEKDQFFAENGITVLDWLKQSIDWHFKIAPLKMLTGPVEWPAVAKPLATPRPIPLSTSAHAATAG